MASLSNAAAAMPPAPKTKQYNLVGCILLFDVVSKLMEIKKKNGIFLIGVSELINTIAVLFVKR